MFWRAIDSVLHPNSLCIASKTLVFFNLNPKLLQLFSLKSAFYSVISHFIKSKR